MKMIRKKEKNEALRQWGKRNLRKGSYSLSFSAVVIVIAVLCNLIVAKLPLKYREIDLSERKLTTIGETTEGVLQNLEQDVTIYQVVQKGAEDENITRLLERYSDLSSHVKVEQVDPVTHPAFTQEYTRQDLKDNSLIVVSDERNRVVNYDDIFKYEFDYYSYSYNTTGFDGEGQITSAISFVTMKDLPILYVVTGHGEMDLSQEMTESIEKGNISTQELNLVTSDAVPEDAGCVMLFSPQTDITEDEADKLITYLEAGGKLFLVTSYSESVMANIQRVLNNYGMQTQEGLIMEGNANNYASGNPGYLVPDICSAEPVSDVAGQNLFVLMPYAQAIEETGEKRDTITVEPLLLTSSDAYIKTDISGSLERSIGDPTGQYAVAAAATETVGDTETRLVYVTSANLFDEYANAMVSGSNLTLFSGILSWMCDFKQTVSIPSKSLSLSYLTVTAASSRLWGLVVVGVVPGALLLFGGVIWFRRRKQ